MSQKKPDERTYSIPSQLLYGQSESVHWDYARHVVPPISASSTFRLETASRGAAGFAAIGASAQQSPGTPPIYVYDRMAEPNNDLLAHGLATAEQCEAAVTFASGMAAVHAATCFALNPGSEIISHKTVYGCTFSLFSSWLPKHGHKTHFVDLTTADAFLPLVNERTRVLYLESPVNPNLEILEIDHICDLVRQLNASRPAEQQILTVMDNTFATPYCQRPATHGVDVVLHSLTKGISGFGTEMGGAVMTRREFLDQLILFRKDFGAVMAPQTAWHILVYGLSTLTLRMPQQQVNAWEIARFLEEHPKVESVRYPGLPSFPQHDAAQRLLRDYEGNFAPGIMVYFTLKAQNPEVSKQLGERMMDYIAQNAYTITLAVSLGQLRTLIEHPGSMTHLAYPAEEQLRLGIDPGGIRLAVGIEPVQDLVRDLEAALAQL